MTRRPVHVVVVAYGAPYELDRCLAALDGQAEVTVVDNSSSTDVRAVAARHGAEYVDPGINLGFGAGVNVAVRHIAEGHPRDVLLLNPDAVLPIRDVDALAGFLHGPGNERVAAVSARLVDAQGAEQRVEWPFPTPAGAWREALRLPARSGAPSFVVGAVLMLRWDALEEVGLFDERFFLYAEEADWQRRAAAHGWRSAVCLDAVAVHAGAGTSTHPGRREALFHAGQETYVRKWHGPSGWYAYRGAVFTGAVLRMVALRGTRRSEAARRALLYLRGPRRCAALVRD